MKLSEMYPETASLDSNDRAELDELSEKLIDKARDEGRAWAEREDDACVGFERGDWHATGTDALPLVEGWFDPSDDNPTYEQQCALAEVVAAAAARRWEELTADQS